MRYLVAALLAFLLGGAAVWIFTHREKPLPDAPALIVKVREVARLETLDVSLYRKIDFTPDPREQKTLWGALSEWATYSLRQPRGRAIVFAVAHLGLDLRKLDASSLHIDGKRIEVTLPRLQTSVELRPAETEIIGSNLDSAQTAELFEKARAAFEADVAADQDLAQRARSSAEQSLRSLFLGLGFQQVDFLAGGPTRG